MNQGAMIAEWDTTSAIMAMHANLNRNQSRTPRPYQPADFNPFDEHGRLKQVQIESSLSVLERHFKAITQELKK
jgi:hypothetical protein